MEEYPGFESMSMGNFCPYDMTPALDSSMCMASVPMDDGMFGAIRHFTFPAENWDNSQPCLASWALPEAPEEAPAPVLSPEFLSKHACDGSVVKNTFIELASQPNSPCSPRGRSKSVPRNMGTLKCQEIEQNMSALGA